MWKSIVLDETIDGGENILVARNIVERIWTVFLNPFQIISLD